MNEMNPNLEKIQRELERYPRGIMECISPDEQEEQAHLKVRTSLIRPGAGPIDVYIRPTRRNRYIATDLGTAMNLLGRHLATDTSSASHWDNIAKTICMGLEIDIRDREWTRTFQNPGDAGSAVMTIAQAQLRTSILASTIKITGNEQTI